MHYYYCTLLVLIGSFSIVLCDDCNRPTVMLKEEEYCLDQVSGFLEKVERYASNAFLSAKRYFGMNTDDQKEESKKCEYYTCIFKRLNLVNDTYEVADKIKVEEWLSKNVIDDVDKRTILNNTINQCFNKLMTNVGVNPNKNQSTTNNENLCEINKELLKCFSGKENDDDKKPNECSTFKYP